MSRFKRIQANGLATLQCRRVVLLQQRRLVVVPVRQSVSSSANGKAHVLPKGIRIASSSVSKQKLSTTSARSTLIQNAINVRIDGRDRQFSPVLLRDLCRCDKCVDTSTKQKLFSTVDIPDLISAAETNQTDVSVQLKWRHDLPDSSPDHVTDIPVDVLRGLALNGNPRVEEQSPPRQLWNSEQIRRDIQDMRFQDYMEDDRSLHQALQILHTHGLLFLTNVPESETGVSTIAERIGPVKNTFYGYTWDVRSVPQAKNVAYTSQDLGFHMDLLYMYQPPHLQFLHCIRSSSLGGASLFTDSFRAARDVHAQDQEAFRDLSEQTVHFHYDHPKSQYYRQVRNVVELTKERRHPVGGLSTVLSEQDVADAIDAVSWSPPFQAPFSIPSSTIAQRRALEGMRDQKSFEPSEWLSSETQRWHRAAKVFNQVIHRPEGIYERMMAPGECVIFDNRRVLHARRAFHVGDAGKERWLRGAYLDKDPYQSRMRLLQTRYGRL